jgi:hypothetical protein
MEGGGVVEAAALCRAFRRAFDARPGPTCVIGITSKGCSTCTPTCSATNERPHERTVRISIGLQSASDYSQHRTTVSIGLQSASDYSQHRTTVSLGLQSASDYSQHRTTVSLGSEEGQRRLAHWNTLDGWRGRESDARPVPSSVHRNDQAAVGRRRPHLLDTDEDIARGADP